ncbi:hypothetical protein [Yoonia sp. I 8.24]|uniref:hypothetical protein n=1 Tax=Yoonia sp. I 8.24 TaxID=1537229 RepID=UPI001EDF3DC0|nr:hypothetical protein [Yoonia sp. I 8.24]MCG3267247.1 hypothetical protein [Yoonia sp. I 8.24]
MENSFKVRAIRNTESAAAQEWFQKNGMPRLAKQCVSDAIDLVCRENETDRLTQHIEHCRDSWDGKTSED